MIERLPGESVLDFTKRRAAELGHEIKLPVRTPEPQEPEPAKAFQWDEDLIPQPVINKTPERLEMDAVLDRVDILEAYRRWCGKMQPNVGKRRESIMVSCPNPAHPDANPSAWVNLDKQTGVCRPCGDLGFDKYTIAAWHFGFPVPGYQDKENFPELRRLMAQDLGYQVVSQGKDEWLVPTAPAKELTVDPAPTDDPVAVAGGVEAGVLPSPPETPPATTFEEEWELDPELEPPKLDWRELALGPDDTFLRRWLELTSESYEPEEFYLWLGLQALAAAVGNNVSLVDRRGNVRPNLLVCLVGGTGSGKSIAIRHAKRLLRDAFPFDLANGGGVRMIGATSSGEALIRQFAYTTTDPATKITTAWPINGFYVEDELSRFTGKANLTGASFKPVLMGFFDSSEPVGTYSIGGGHYEASDHFMQMVSGTQPSRVNDLVTNRDVAAGLINRIVFAYGTHKEAPARGGITIDVTPCVEILQRVNTWAARGRTVDFNDQDAADAWDAFYDDKIRPLLAQDDDSSGMTARLDLLAKKLVLLFAINDKSTTILTHHVEMMIRLWDFVKQGYGIVDDNIGVNELGDCVRRVEKYFLEHPAEGITMRVLKNNSGARKYKNNLDLINRSVEILEKAGTIVNVRSTGSKRWQTAGNATPIPAGHIATVTPINARRQP